ncbi:MAG TPA: hypothetical protein VNM14_03355 [Planctomycetota bacterium]|jgi:hypothetical protein|nr:hypothetical protein [Planctomycetota bacterium]
MKTLLLSALALLLVQDAENPDYKRWASFKVGSWVKFKTEIEANGNKMALPVETTMTLLELDEKQVVIEEMTVNTLQPKDSPKQEKAKKRTYKATRRQKDGDLKEGDEEIEVAGKKLACHWTEVTGVGGSVKTWVTPEVPGFVRMDVGLPSKSIQRLNAISWEKK